MAGPGQGLAKYPTSVASNSSRISVVLSRVLARGYATSAGMESVTRNRWIDGMDDDE